ncbi:AAA family ATPase [Kiritimatiellaeota bacterium B1221]|nr:AAA family ATPase [Kiritimatiellaeota bacterium B1221]
MKSTTETKLDCALKYASRGWHVLPIIPNGKKPACKNGVNDATTDSDQIRKWWDQNPNYNVAVATGKSSGVAVVDVDIDSSKGINGFAWLDSQDIELDSGITQDTPRGGKHFFFALGEEDVRNQQGGSTGIDVRGDGGYILMAPSDTAKGAYKLHDVDDMAHMPSRFITPVRHSLNSEECDVQNVTFSDIEQALPDALEMCIDYLKKEAEPAIQGKSGHNTLLSVCQSLVTGCGMPLEQATDLLWEHYNPRCNPPWDPTSPEEVKDFERKAHEALINPIEFPKLNFRDVPYAILYAEKLLEEMEVAEGIDAIPETKIERKGMRLVSCLELVSDPKPIDWLIHKVIPSLSLVFNYGERGCLKSFLLIDMLFHVATGKPWRGATVKQGPVVILAGEGQGGMAQRVQGWMQENGVSQNNVPFYVSDRGGNLDDQKGLDSVFEALDELEKPPVVVAVDTLARWQTSEENSTSDSGRMVQAFDSIRDRYECTVIVIHHVGHNEKSRMRGAYAYEGAADALYLIKKKEGKEQSHVTMECKKMKEAKEPSTMAWNAQVTPIHGLLDEGEQVTTLTLEPLDQVPDTTSKKGRKPLFEDEQIYKVIRENPDASQGQICKLVKGNEAFSTEAVKKRIQDLEKEGMINSSKDSRGTKSYTVIDNIITNLGGEK